MKEFKQLYDNKSINTAKADFRNAILIYCAVALFFAAFCIAFVVMYVKIDLSVYLCFALNFIATVAFCWFSVIFFYTFLPKKREIVRFFKAFENAEISFSRGTFSGKKEEDKNAKTAFVSLEFLNGGERAEYLVLKGTPVPFIKGKNYHLQTLGNRITAYKEAESD